MEVYIQIQGVAGDIDKISFTKLSMGRHVSIWWESHVENLKHENQPKIFSWEEFERFMKEQFYPLGYHNK